MRIAEDAAEPGQGGREVSAEANPPKTPEAWVAMLTDADRSFREKTYAEAKDVLSPILFAAPEHGIELHEASRACRAALRRRYPFEHAASSASARKSPLRSYTAAQLHALAMTRPPRELIVSPFMAKYESVFLYAYKGHGKTWVSLGAAMVCAHGEGGRFLNFEGVGPGVATLFVDGEMFTTDLDQRVEDIKKSSPGLEPGDLLHLWTPDAQDDAHTILNLFSEEGRRMLEDHIADIYDETGQVIEQIFLDNMASLLHGWEENEQKSWLEISPWLLQLRAQRRGNFWVHHAGKTLDYRGNSAMIGSMHAILKVARPKDAAPGASFDLTYEYTRAKPAGLQNFNARLEGDVWTVETTGQVADELIRILTGQGLSLRVIADQIGKGKNAVALAQKRLGLKPRKGDE